MAEIGLKRGRFYLVVAILLLIASQSFLNRRLQRISFPSAQAPREPASPILYRLFSFGHLPVAVDWIMIRFLTSSSHAKSAGGNPSAAYQDLDLGTELDPAFFELYVAGANFLAVVADDGARARDLLKKGNRFRAADLPSYPSTFRERFWSRAWEIPLLQAYVHLFELDDMPSAAVAIEEAAAIAGAPAYLTALQRRLEKVGGQYEVGLRLINFMIQTAEERSDENARQRLEERRKSLFISQYLFHLNLMYRNFLAARPEYRQSDQISKSRLESYWKQFRRERRIAERDPWGGLIHLDSHGRVTTTTPREKVMGLE